MSDSLSVCEYNTKTLKGENYFFSLPEDNHFPILAADEQITTRNILISSEIFYAIGTNTGRALLITISTSKKQVYSSKFPVSSIYLHKSTLAIAYSNETLSF